MPAALISLIGPPASGKTTAAEFLARGLEGRLILEDYAGNPFLAESYLGRSESALPAQLYFLYSRLGQLKLGTWPETGLVVSDYGFCQDAIYAHHNLRGEDLDVYRRLASATQGVVKPPDVLVHLDGPETTLLERIARRGRSYESAFTAEFLGGIRRACMDAAAAATCPVVRVDVGCVDLREPVAREELLRRTREVLP